jgi:hypothetical protein
MVFIFNDTPGMHAVATTASGLAGETTAGGTQCEASGATVMPCGTDPVSGFNATVIKAQAALCNAHLANAGVNQHNYGASISESAAAYSQTDLLNAAGVAEVGVSAAQVAAGLSSTWL